jgi:ubiquinone/menaquinone biosynthesis C-methylase UbiE
MRHTPARPPLAESELELESVACDLCGGSETRERYRKPDSRRWVSLHEFPVVECVRCGLVYVNPRPTPAGMAPFYDEGYHEGRDSPRHHRRYARQLAFLPPLEDQTILDIGCARGDFLAYALSRHPGIRAHGVDAYSSGVRDERICFQKQALPDCRFPDDQFDVVTAWAVFEHLHRPSLYFEEVRRVLKPGGRFVFLVTNSESLWGRRAYGEDVPRHTYHFSQPVLEKYAEKHGFDVAHVTFHDKIFDGRGKGTFRWMLSRAAGLTWPAYYRRDMSLFQGTARLAGKAIDGVVFSLHWERRLKRSGIVVAEFKKPGGGTLADLPARR